MRDAGARNKDKKRQIRGIGGWCGKIDINNWTRNIRFKSKFSIPTIDIGHRRKDEVSLDFSTNYKTYNYKITQ